MRIINIMSARRRRGVSTILGTIIFVGILFTSVIPMLLVMKQADTIYTEKVHEMEARDDERDNEILEASAFPVNTTSDELQVKLKNIGVVSAKIIRVWINDDNYSESTVVQAGDTSTVGPYSVTLENDTTYAIKITTERGKTYASTTGVLYYTDGYWFTPSIGVNIVVLNWFGKYQIRVYNGTWTSPDPYQTQGIDIGDVQWTEVNMTNQGNYFVEVKKKIGSDYLNVPGTPVPIVIQWPGGSPMVNVIVDARDF
jgi:archaellum component FlaF (FlaF/FlaG flagellin family)